MANENENGRRKQTTVQKRSRNKHHEKPWLLLEVAFTTHCGYSSPRHIPRSDITSQAGQICHHKQGCLMKKRNICELVTFFHYFCCWLCQGNAPNHIEKVGLGFGLGLAPVENTQDKISKGGPKTHGFGTQKQRQPPPGLLEI